MSAFFCSPQEYAFVGTGVDSGLPGAYVTIDGNTTLQKIDGLGASASGYTGTFTPAQADGFFSPTTGLGLSLLRILVLADTENADCGCTASGTPYTCVSGAKTQIVSGDLQVDQPGSSDGINEPSETR